MLILRTCNADMTSHSGFHWPESGPVEAPADSWFRIIRRIEEPEVRGGWA